MPNPRPEGVSPSGSRILALVALVLSRICCSFQYQSVTLLAPFLSDRLGIAVTEFGFLLGLYMAPGLFTAVGVPLVMRRFGEQGTLQLALCLMAVGQCLLVFAASFWLACAGRLLSGIGGCIIYIGTIDLAARLAGAGPLPLRMGAIAASWPAGNALALVVLGMVGATGAYHLTGLLPIGFVLLSAVMLAFTFRLLRRDRGSGGPPEERPGLARWIRSLKANLLVGLTFATYNLGFITFTSFAYTLLTDAGYAPGRAASLASLPMWAFIVSVPLGGVLASAVPGHQGLIIVVGCLGAAGAVLLSAFAEEKELWYFLIGLLGGLPTGPILARAARSRIDGKPDELAYSGLFFVSFASLLVFPPLLGATVEWSGDVRTVIWSFVLLQLVALLLLHLGGRKP